MKIVLAGNWHSDIHEEPMAKALGELGCEVVPFRWHGYFRPYKLNVPGSSVIWKAQRRLALGPRVRRLNRDLVKLAKQCRPDTVFVYRGDMILPGTIASIRAIIPGVVIIGYNNDDPFSPKYSPWYWRHFKRSIPIYDLVLAYRHHNLEEYRQAGAKRVELLRSWYVPGQHYPLEPGPPKKFDIVFIGHYEADGRKELLEALVSEGVELGMFGPDREWDPHIGNSPYLGGQVPVRAVWGEEYNLVLNQTKIALCFFSSLNRDTYTRRCFEIPAAGAMMLAQYSADLAAMFEPDIEAVYFSDREELLEKVRWLLRDDKKRMEIAAAGHRKVKNAGHDIGSRMEGLLALINEVKAQKLDGAA